MKTYIFKVDGTQVVVKAYMKLFEEDLKSSIEQLTFMWWTLNPSNKDKTQLDKVQQIDRESSIFDQAILQIQLVRSLIHETFPKRYREAVDRVPAVQESRGVFQLPLAVDPNTGIAAVRVTTKLESSYLVAQLGDATLRYRLQDLVVRQQELWIKDRRDHLLPYDLGVNYRHDFFFLFNRIAVINSLDFCCPRLLRVGDDIFDVPLALVVTVVLVATVAAIALAFHACTHG